MKVLFHIDSESNWDMVLENARNMRKYEQERQVAFEIEIVANGAAVEGLQRSSGVVEIAMRQEEGYSYIKP